MATRGPVPFEPVDHTGDRGLVVRAPSLAALFERAAAAMFQELVDLDGVEPREEEAVEVEAPDREALLVAWLSELLLRHATSGRLYAWFEVAGQTETRLEARVRGERAVPGRHALHQEIKAVTYHGLRVAREGDGWMARVIFDV